MPRRPRPNQTPRLGVGSVGPGRSTAPVVGPRRRPGADSFGAPAPSASHGRRDRLENQLRHAEATRDRAAARVEELIAEILMLPGAVR